MDEKTGAGPAHQQSAHQAGCFICTTAIPMLERLWSETTHDHFRNSRLEFLKGVRSLIDDRIAHLSRHQERKGTHVTVE
jgi:predicted amidohydrolase